MSPTGRLALARETDQNSAGERISREDRIVKDRRLGFALEQMDLQFFPKLVGLRARLPAAQLSQVMTSLVTMPEAVVNHRQEGPVLGTTISVPELNTFFQPADRVRESTRAIERSAKTSQGALFPLGIRGEVYGNLGQVNQYFKELMLEVHEGPAPVAMEEPARPI